MKRVLTVISLCFFLLSLFAQSGRMQGIMETDSFPYVSFLWHEYDPHPSNITDAEIIEDGIVIYPSVKRIIQDEAALSKPREIVILIEDMYCNGKMFQVEQVALLSFIESINLRRNEDFIAIAVFNRKNADEKTLCLLTDDFYDRKEVLSDALVSYKRSTRLYSECPRQSDVYPAILEALQLLQNRRKNRADDIAAQSIFVFTAGRALESSATNSAVEVQRRALEQHIPVYIMQYGVLSGASSVVEGLGRDTYGEYMLLNALSEKANINSATLALTSWYDNLAENYNGNDYKIVFKGRSKRGESEKAVQLRINGNSYKLRYIPAKHNFLSWNIRYWYVPLLIIVLLVLSIVFAIIYRNRQKKENRSAQSMLQSRMEENRRQMQQEMEAQKVQMSGQVSALQAQLSKNIEQKKETQQNELFALMQQKNLFPRFQYADKQGNIIVYDMLKPQIIIGRDEDADMQLDNLTVSRRHALVSYSGSEFIIEDIGSSNGTIVNGTSIDRATPLHDRDVINLGNEMITFYL